jgi:hypothetical protein
VRHARWYFENFSGKMIDAVEKTASACNENAGAEVIEE